MAQTDTLKASASKTMTMPRWVHRFRAWLGGYFWTPCPRCGRMFGGHERPSGRLMINDSEGFITCSHCAIAEENDYRMRAGRAAVGA